MFLSNGTFVMGALYTAATYTAATTCTHARTNDLAVWHESTILLANWNSALVGIGVVGAVFWRSVNPAFTLGADLDAIEEVELPPSALTGSNQTSSRRD